MLALVAAATWYGLRRAQLARRAPQRFGGVRPVRSDLSGWGRAG